MARVTIKQLNKKAAELLILRQAYERYQALEQEIKEGLVKVGYKELDLGEAGRVFISTSERVTVSPAVARDVLGEALAGKIIQVKEFVPNNLIKAFVEVGEISEADRERLLEGAERTAMVSLYVRPLR